MTTVGIAAAHPGMAVRAAALPGMAVRAAALPP
jgi:hypothetical protein